MRAANAGASPQYSLASQQSSNLLSQSPNVAAAATGARSTSLSAPKSAPKHICRKSYAATLNSSRRSSYNGASRASIPSNVGEWTSLPKRGRTRDDIEDDDNTVTYRDTNTGNRTNTNAAGRQKMFRTYSKSYAAASSSKPSSSLQQHNQRRAGGEQPPQPQKRRRKKSRLAHKLERGWSKSPMLPS
eukprot:CAMPEP_0183718970 /NCGR_PEP_ID=MMETSP0737-20130205/12082_1 /TAXON_ID=385413 /ORGANISM="Thalassiosira miniscula, Strain CCMP1093" /LENGTH=186 /DNA_ID=CAMNT_0025948629 /DNA_START=59 /DNA_END=616 /DNA_ORIENTATION=+